MPATSTDAPPIPVTTSPHTTRAPRDRDEPTTVVNPAPATGCCPPRTQVPCCAPEQQASRRGQATRGVRDVSVPGLS